MAMADWWKVSLIAASNVLLSISIVFANKAVFAMCVAVRLWCRHEESVSQLLTASPCCRYHWNFTYALTLLHTITTVLGEAPASSQLCCQ